MTLIASLSVNGTALLIGDVLRSAEGRTGIRATLPLVGDINDVLANRGFSFEVSFVQKLNILSDRLVVAWSGPEVQAERAHRVLTSIASRPNLSRDDIQNELEAIDQTRIDKLQMIALLVTDVQGPTVSASLIWRGVPNTAVAGLGTVYAAGTGRNGFLELLGQADWSAGGAGDVFQMARALLGALVNQEYRRGGTIENRWGGGFEAVTFDRDTGRLEKVGDIMHTFWAVDLRTKRTAQFFPRFYKTTYWQEALIIRYARFDRVAERKYQLVMNSLELIPPFLRDPTEYDLSALGSVTFSHKALCCHVEIDRVDGHDSMHVILPPKTGEILEFDASSGLLHIPEQITNVIIAEAHARAARP